MDFINWHGHTDASNHNNRDSIIKTNQMIDIALELGHSGVGITDHAVLSNHVKAILHLKEKRKEINKMLEVTPNSEILQDKKRKLDNFKLGLGCELYVVNRDEVNGLREDNKYIKFYHLVVLPKDFIGYRQLAKLSTIGWENSFYYRGLERTPVYKEDLRRIVEENKGHLIVTSACLGSEFATYVIEYLDSLYMKLTDRAEYCYRRIVEYIKFMKELFEDDFYIELQPNHGEQQIQYNQFALKIAKYYNIKAIISTDAHYHRPNTVGTHSIFLKAQNAERETESFYSSTYMMPVEEIREYCKYISDEDFEWIIGNTIEIGNKIEEIDLYKPTQVPDATIEFDKNHKGFFHTIKDVEILYPYIHKYVTSEYMIDKIILQQIEKGMKNLNQDCNKVNLERINKE